MKPNHIVNLCFLSYMGGATATLALPLESRIVLTVGLGAIALLTHLNRVFRK